MSNNPELDAALLKLETKHRFESFLIKLGTNEDAAKLIASSPDQLAKVQWDGVNLHFGKSDLAAVDDDAAKSHFTGGRFKALFAPAASTETNGDDNDVALDDADVALMRSGNAMVATKVFR